MHNINKRSALLALLVLASSSARAADPTTIGCPSGWIPAVLLVYATATASSGCPLLLDKEPRELINKFGVGTAFAYPAIPGTCLSGSLDATPPSTLTVGGVEYQLDPELSYSESAQRLFPVPDGQGFPIGTDFDGSSVTYLGGSPNLLALDEANIPADLQAGAAMTVFHLEGTGGSFSLDLISDDHFLLNPDGDDVEDFHVIGSAGDGLASGRFTGNGRTIRVSPLTISFEISGRVCLKATHRPVVR